MINNIFLEAGKSAKYSKALVIVYKGKHKGNSADSFVIHEILGELVDKFMNNKTDLESKYWSMAVRFKLGESWDMFYLKEDDKVGC